MYSGEAHHTMDAKGRVSLPAIYRRALPEQVIISKGIDNNLYVQTPEEREAWLTSLYKRDDLDPKSRRLFTALNAGSATVDIDSAGRMNVPANLRDFAGLSKNVVVFGNIDRIELWDEDRWNDFNEEIGSIDDIVSSLAANRNE